MSSNDAAVGRVERWSVDNDDTNEFWGMFNSRERAEKECDRANDGHQVGKFVVRHLREVPPPSPAVAETETDRLASTTDTDPVQAFRDTCMRHPPTPPASASPADVLRPNDRHATATPSPAPLDASESVPTAEEVAERHMFYYQNVSGIQADINGKRTQWTFSPSSSFDINQSIVQQRQILTAIITADRAACSADRDRLARRVAELEGEVRNLKCQLHLANEDYEMANADRNDLRAKLAAAGGGVDKDLAKVKELTKAARVWAHGSAATEHLCEAVEILAAMRQDGGGE